MNRADACIVEVSPARLPNQLMVLVLAFAPYEARPLLAAAELFRGMAIQLAYRWASGQLLALDGDRAVLLTSVCGPRGRREMAREVPAVLTSVLTGIVLFCVSNALLLTIVTVMMHALRAGPETTMVTRFGILAVRLAITLWRAVRAYRHDARLAAALPAQTGTRWSLDLLAASAEGKGYGRELLQRFLARADAADAEVVLHCDGRNVAFYAHHGFALAPDQVPGSQLLMIRPVASRRPRPPRQERPRLQGHLRKGGLSAAHP